MRDPRYYLAAERTLLAWIRTGLAMMGLGFVVARFGFFLREIEVAKATYPIKPSGFSFWFGMSLVVLGVMVNVGAALNHVKVMRRIERGEPSFAKPSVLAITAALVLAAVGLGMAIVLVSLR